MADLPPLQGLNPSTATPIFAVCATEASGGEAAFDPVEEAYLALRIFESVDAGIPLETLLLDDESGKVKLEDLTSRSETRERLEGLVEECNTKGLSLVLRMQGSGPRSRQLIQIDDICDRDTLERLRPVSFLQIETSPGSFQSWVAVDCEAEAFEGIRDRLLRAVEGTANGGGYGSLRFPGSRNCKPNRRGPDGAAPFVMLTHSIPGRRVTEAELIEKGILSAAPASKNATQSREARPIAPPVIHSSAFRWIPQYSIELETAQGDRSRADFRFSILCLVGGASESEACELLLAASEKAKSRRDDYVQKTVARAAEYVRSGAASVAQNKVR